MSQSSCTGHILFSHVIKSTQEPKEKTLVPAVTSLFFTSLLTDSNNQDTRIHRSASSTSFLKDSSYWFLIYCPASPWNEPESTQGTFRKRWEEAVTGRSHHTGGQPWLRGFLYPNTSQRDCKDFPTLEWIIDKEKLKVQKAHAAELTILSSLQTGERTVQWLTLNTKFYSEVHVSWPETWDKRSDWEVKL